MPFIKRLDIVNKKGGFEPMEWHSKTKYIIVLGVTILVAFLATHRIDVNTNDVRLNPLDVKIVEEVE